MPRIWRPDIAGVMLAILALSACGGDERTADAAPISDNVEFVDLFDDARAEMGQGNLDAADRLFGEAREIEPDNPALWVEIARLRFRRGQHIEAVEAADYALEQGPDYAPALFMRAQLVRDSLGLSEALPWYEAAVSADPENVEMLADYAATLGDLGRNRDMLAVLHKVDELSPGYPRASYLRAVLAARAGLPVLSRSLLAKSGLAEQGIPSAVLLDAVLDLQEELPDAAIGKLETLAQRQPANQRVRELLARALWLGGRDEDLVARFGELATAPDATPYLTMLVGRAYERMGDRTRAAPLIEQALAAREVRLVALANYGDLPDVTASARAMASRRNFDGAREAASGALSRSPGSSDLLALAGDTALLSGDPAAAMAHYTRASSVRRPWPLTRKIIFTTRALGDDRAADALLSRTVVGEPRNTEALLMFAQRRAEAEDWERVATLTGLVFALGGGNDTRVLDLQARAAEATGRPEDAARWDLTAEALRPGRFVRAQ